MEIVTSCEHLAHRSIDIVLYKWLLHVTQTIELRSEFSSHLSPGLFLWIWNGGGGTENCLEGVNMFEAQIYI